MPNNKKIKIYFVDATTRPTRQIIHISVKISQIGHNTCHIIYHTVYPLSMENASFSRKIQRCISNTTSKMHDILPFVFNNRLSLSSIP